MRFLQRIVNVIVTYYYVIIVNKQQINLLQNLFLRSFRCFRGDFDYTPFLSRFSVALFHIYDRWMEMKSMVQQEGTNFMRLAGFTA